MAITTLSMVLTVLVLNLHSISDRPVPGWMRVLVLQYLARLFCKCEYVERKATLRSLVSAERLANHVTKKTRAPAHYGNSMTSLPVAESRDCEQVPIIAMNGGGGGGPLENGHANGEDGFVYIKSNANIYRRVQKPYSNTCPALYEYISDEQHMAAEGNSAAQDYGKEWQKLAEVAQSQRCAQR